VSQELWQIATSASPSQGQWSPEPLLKHLWRRFLDSFVLQSSPELEDAVSRVLGAMPKMVNVPREAADLALPPGRMVGGADPRLDGMLSFMSQWMGVSPKWR